MSAANRGDGDIPTKPAIRCAHGRLRGVRGKPAWVMTGRRTLAVAVAVVEAGAVVTIGKLFC